MISDKTGSGEGEYCIAFQNVLDAAAKIQGIAHRTPVLTSSSLNELAGRQLFFKVEAMQRTGSFKFRGALNATLTLVEDLDDQLQEKENNQEVHVVTHSSGNHAAALALAAKLGSAKTGQNIRSTIVMPENAPIIKVNGVKGFGGDIVFVESTNEAREEMADQIVEEQDASFIHPSEDPRVIAGQGTASVEFIEQMKEMTCHGSKSNASIVDAIIIPVGGGGLAAGNTIALRGLLGNNVKVRADS